MANQHSQKLRGIRGVDDDLWADLDTAAKAAGSDRSKVTRELWEWYVRRPGAQLPERAPEEVDPDRLTLTVLMNLTAGKTRIDDLTEGQRRNLDRLLELNFPERPVGGEEKNA